MRRYRRRTALQCPHAHPLVQWLFREMHHQRIDILDLAERAGLGKHTIRDWARKRNPAVQGLEAALNVLGYQLVVTKRPEPGEVGSRGRVR